MAEALLARAAFAGALPPGRSGLASGEPGVTAREAEIAGCVQLAARTGGLPALLEAVRGLGLALPERPEWAAGGGLQAVWLGPEKWLVFGPDDLESMLRARLGGLASVSDQSDSRAVLRLEGPNVREALAKGVPVDLHPRAFPPGRAAVTQLAHMGVVLWRGGEAAAFDLAVARSYAGTLADWLTGAAAEFGLAME